MYPSCCLSRAIYSRVLRPSSRWLLQISKDLHSHSKSLCQCFVTRASQKRCLMFKGNLLCSGLCPLPVVMFLGTTEKNLTQPSLYPPFRYLYALMGFPLCFLWVRTFNYSSHKRCFEFLHWTVPVAPCPSFTGKITTGQRMPGVALPELSRGKGSFPSSCWQQFASCSLQYCEPSLWHIAGSWSTQRPPGAPVPFLP